MKSITKSIIVTLAFVLCTGISLTYVSAVGYNYCKGDINNDGVINSRDLLYFDSFLSGQEAIDGYIAERLDIDRNFVINVCDYEYLQRILLGTESTSLISSENTNALPSNTSVTYNVYNPVTGIRTNSYPLYSCPSMNLNSEPVSTCGIINGDDRTFQDGMQGVVNVQLSDGSNHGTAFVVGPHTILTAGHVLYNYKTHNLYQNLQFKVFDEYDTPTNVTITPTSYHIPLNFCFSNYNYSYNCYEYVAEWDYGIVTVSQDLSDYINFDLGVMRSGNMRKDVFVTGFGGYGKSNDIVISDFIYNKSTGLGRLIRNNPYNDYFINYNADTVGGDSGGPVWILNEEDNHKTVIGINIFETFNTDDGTATGNPTDNLYNTGLRINTNILHAIYNNSYLNNSNNNHSIQ